MKITKKDNRYTIELGRREYLLLKEAVEYGATWMNENGYRKDEEKMLKLYNKLEKGDK